ncbi:hypothetical protein FQV27_06330 [Paracoccus aurantiacus]|uniref:Uncharacterized protein n=1 Tax=Paracoccus aurantiacus TaxID=2599412 RepID=A0A5C6S5M2_9RHOB|nr:DUF6173 family protein [Paracoccus aurantiacus]TXB69735.1 hypothetical protein FQV27_06330 [Paracoccus aurantiacus]
MTKKPKAKAAGAAKDIAEPKKRKAAPRKGKPPAAEKARAEPTEASSAEAPVPVQMQPVPAIAEDLWPKEDAADMATLHAAEEVFNHLVTRVKDFQATLPEHYELGIQLANFGSERAVHVRGMGYRNPSIIEFYGLLDGITEVAVVQHVSQLNFMLVAVPPLPEQPPYRIGFGAEL